MTLELNDQEGTNFLFDIILIPDIKYKLTEVNIPSTSIGFIENYPSFAENRLTFPGDTITYDDLTINFIVDKKLQNFYYLYKWMEELILSVRKIEVDMNEDPIIIGIQKYQYSDAILFVKSGDKTERKIRFKNIFPYNLGSLDFESTAEYKLLTCTASFKYEKFEFYDDE